MDAKRTYGHVTVKLLIGIILILTSNLLIAQPEFHYLPEKIGWHEAVYDFSAKEAGLVPWTTWDDALEREMQWYLNAPVNDKGYPSYVHITFMNEKYEAYRNDFIPATQNGMGIISYLKYWEYKGKKNPKILEVAIKMGDYLVNEANTPNEGAYPNFTRSTGFADVFPLTKSSQNDADYGKNIIEPDKGGVAGYALLELFKATNDKRYFNQAIHNALILSKNMRPGNAARSPWPFRVDAKTGQYWGERSGDMVYILRLFDGLTELGHKEFQSPGRSLWNWISEYQLNAPDDPDHSLWVQFFEDQPKEDNRNAWSPLNMARYLI